MTEGEHMVRILAALAVAATMLAGASSEASAWVCRAAGLGSGGWARSYNVVDAKIGALRRGGRNSPGPGCPILWGRARGQGDDPRKVPNFLVRSYGPTKPLG